MKFKTLYQTVRFLYDNFKNYLLLIKILFLVDSFLQTLSTTHSSLMDTEDNIRSLQISSDQIEKEILIKRETLEMLPSATANIGMLFTLDMIFCNRDIFSKIGSNMCIRF